MKKTYYFFILLLFSYVNTNSITVYHDAPEFYTLGYDNCDMKKNGESNVIRSFISKGGIVFDVGANIGEWSLEALTQEVATIFAFEPLPEVFATLIKEVKNQNFTAFNIALGDKQGERNFVYYKQFSALSGFYNRPIVEQSLKFAPTEIKVTVDTLDHICDVYGINHINFLKIDTEGAELFILNGAQNMLQKNAIDFIQFEYGGTYPDAGITLKQVYNLLSYYHYTIFRIIPEGLIYINSWRDQLENSRYSNYLAVSAGNLDKVLPK